MFRRKWELCWQEVARDLEKRRQILQKEEMKRTEGVLRQGEEATEAESRLKRVKVEEQAAQNKNG